MPSSANGPSPVARKFAWLVGAMVAAGLLWTFGWFFFASRIEDQLPATLARIVGPGTSADCAGAEVRGYPFRVGLFCESVSYANPAQSISATSGAFRSAAQFYRPQHVVGEIDGPFMLDTSGLILRADWQLLQASVRATSNGLGRGSIDARNASVNIDGAGLAQRFALEVDRVTAHARQNGPDLDIAVYGENLRNTLIAGLGARTVSFEASLSGQSTLLQIPFTPLRGPFEGVLHRLAIEFDETASLDLAGPLQVGPDGRLSASLELTVNDLQQLSALAARISPESAELINRFGPVISALDIRPGDDATTLPLTITNNQVSLGIIPLGELPAF